MRKELKKVLFIVFFAMITIIMINTHSKAASAAISCSSSGKVGEAIKISVSGTGVQWNLNLKVNGTTIASSSELDNYEKNIPINFSGTYTPTAEGKVTVTLEGTVTDYSTGDTIRSFNSKKINITKANNTNNNDNSNNNNNNNNNNNGGSTGGTTTTNKPETPTKSSNANLSNLGITPNDFSGFTPGNTSYSVTVPNSVTSINVYAYKGQEDQTISGTGTKTLQEGENQFSVVVTAQDGTKKTYTINVTREAMTQENTVVDETAIEDVTDVVGLKELTISGVELSPAFDQNVYEYTAKLIGDKTTLDIQAIPVNENQKVEIIGNEDLKEGENVITILVTGTTTTENTENTVTTNTTAGGTQTSENTITYQIIVNKSLVDEEAIAREKQEEQQRMQRMIIIGVLVLAIVIILIILLVRAIRSRREPEEFDGMYMQDNDNFIDNQFETDNNINENKYSEKIEDNNYTDEYEEFDHKKRNKGKRFK